MVRRKTTVYLDEELLRAMKVAAAREDKPDYLVVEDALREHLGRDLFARVGRRSGLTADEAARLAVDEVRADRSKRRR